MRDVVLLATLLGFFALAAAYVRGADRLVGADDVPAARGPVDQEPGAEGSPAEPPSVATTDAAADARTETAR